MIVLIDHRDSFVYNLARYFVLTGQKVEVLPYQALANTHQIASLESREDIKAYVFSPGPCAPSDMKPSLLFMQHILGRVPILGVCLGHQMIGELFGLKIKKAKRPLHGQASFVFHNHSELFIGCDNPLEVGRYHSLIVESASSSPLRIDAYSEEQEIMALSEPTIGVWGVQFHPESILTPQGSIIISNFLQAT